MTKERIAGRVAGLIATRRVDAATGWPAQVSAGNFPLATEKTRFANGETGFLISTGIAAHCHAQSISQASLQFCKKSLAELFDIRFCPPACLPGSEVLFLVAIAVAFLVPLGYASAQQHGERSRTARGARPTARCQWQSDRAGDPAPPRRGIATPSETDRVVVTGTNIATSESPPFVPESIYSRDAIDRSGARSLGDFFQTLPQNSGPTFTENQNDSLSPGAAAVALRGLSPDATLVLLNGRRVAPYPFAQAGITAFVDLNTLPMAAILQIDILRDGASAIYGTDAIAGVVNVRLLEKFNGTQINFGYGNTTDTDTGEFRASVISGFTNEQRGIEVVAVADYYHRNALFQVDRYFSESIDQRRQGGSSFLSSVANPGTIFDPVTGDPLRVPANSTGTPTAAQLRARPGRNRFDRAPFQPLVPETRTLWRFHPRESAGRAGGRSLCGV